MLPKTGAQEERLGFIKEIQSIMRQEVLGRFMLHLPVLLGLMAALAVAAVAPLQLDRLEVPEAVMVIVVRPVLLTFREAQGKGIQPERLEMRQGLCMPVAEEEAEPSQEAYPAVMVAVELEEVELLAQEVPQIRVVVLVVVAPVLTLQETAHREALE